MKNVSNQTSPGDMPDTPTEFLVMIYTTIIVSMCGIIANGFLLVVFAADPLRCLRNISSGLILNLCISDFLTALMLFLWSTTYWKWASEKLTDVIFCLVWFGYSASFLTIALLSVERYIVIRYIWSADTIVTKRRTAFAVVMVWLVSSISFVRLDKEMTSVYMFILSSVFELCVLVVITFYLKLWIIRQRHVPQEHRALIKHETKLTKVVFVLIVLLVLTTMPLIFLYQLLYGLHMFCGDQCISKAVHYTPTYLTPIFASNFAFNPVIYGWRLPKYRRSFAALCGIVLPNSARRKRDNIVTYKSKDVHSLDVNTTQVTASCTSL